MSKTNLKQALRAKRSGFSLLELLVALTILAIALVPVAYFYTRSLQMVEKASIQTKALMLCQERVAEIEQMPYDQIRTNVTPSRTQLKMYSDSGDINTTAADWYGYDFEDFAEWQGMFFYPLPLTYNPYQPQTQGYDNSIGAQHYVANNPIGGVFDSHINFNNGGPEVNYEYEPIGFYQQKIANRNNSLSGVDRGDIRLNDRRTIPAIEPSLPLGGGGFDAFRVGTPEEVEKYAGYGRRTIIIDVIPNTQDTDPANGLDSFAPNDDRDGGATALDPYPLSKGPDNKFQMVSDYGSQGKLLIVQVFWLPRGAEEGYIPWEEMNKVELKTFIPASNDGNTKATDSGTISSTDQLFISLP